MKHEVHGEANCNWRTWNNLQRMGKRKGRRGNKTSGDHPNCSIVKIGQNTEESPG